MKKQWGTWLFSEELIKLFILCWWNNEALEVFTAEITFAGLLRQQAQVPHYFFRQKSSTRWFLQKKMLIFYWRNNEVLHFFYEENTFACSLRCWANRPYYLFRRKWRASFCRNNDVLIFFWRNNEAPHFFLRNNGAIDFFTEENKFTCWFRCWASVHHYLFRKNEVPEAFFLKT